MCDYNEKRPQYVDCQSRISLYETEYAINGIDCLAFLVIFTYV